MVSRGTLKKIRQAAPELMRAGILAPDAMEKLAEFRSASGIPLPLRRTLIWLLRLLALSFFLGGMLLLARYFWMECPPFVRILFGTLPLLPAAIFGFWALRRTPFFLRDSGAIVLACAFAGALAVVRTNTQIDWDASDFLRETALMSLVLVWLFDSLLLSGAVTAEALFLLFWEEELSSAFFLPAALLPYLLCRIFRPSGRTTAAQSAGGLLLFLAAASAIRFSGEKTGVDGCTLFAFLAALVILAGIAAARVWKKHNVFSIAGELLAITFLTLAGFRFFWEKHFPWHLILKGSPLTLCVFSGTAALLLVLLLFSILAARKEKIQWEKIALALLLLPLPPLSCLRIPAAIFSALFLLGAHAICQISLGLRRSSFFMIFYGTALLMMQALFHFFFPENLSRKHLGIIFLVCCLFSLAVTAVAKKHLLEHREEEEQL